MTVGILVVSHEQLGAQLIAIAESILCSQMRPVACVSVPANVSPQQLGKYADLIRDSIIQQDDGAAQPVCDAPRRTRRIVQT